MRVMLVRPNARLRSTYLPLGLGYIAGAVRDAGHEVAVMDARLQRLSAVKTINGMLDFEPDVVGLTALHDSAEKKAVLDIAGRFKRAGGRAPVVLGGPLVATSGREMVAGGRIDAAVVGEGENTMVRYLEALAGRREMNTVPGIFYRRDDLAQENAPAEFIEDIDRLQVAWDLLRPRRYFSPSGRSSQSTIKKSHRCLPVFTSRGCPFGCIYCHNIFGRKLRTRSPDSVVDELEMLCRRYGVKEIEIEDDCFNIDLNRAKEIASRIIDRRLNLALSFPTGLRADRMDRELVDLLRAAGTYRIIYAVETAVPRLQKLIRKNIDFERARQMIDYTADSGIMTCGFFMQGFPTETEAEMRQTIDYALKSGFHQAFFFYVNPFPGTALAKEFPVKEALVANPDKLDYFTLRVNLSEVSSRTMKRLHKTAYRRFYFSFRRIRRAWRVTPKNPRTLWAVMIALLLSFRELDDF